MPSSVLRSQIPQARSRQSLAPNQPFAPQLGASTSAAVSGPSRGRQSVLPGAELRPPATVGRLGSYGRGMMGGLGDQSLVMSVGRQGIMASSRRGAGGVSNTPFKGRQSLAPASFAPQIRVTKDPRPKDKTASANNILDYLLGRGYQDSPLTLKTLLQPTTKDFQLIFKFLASRLNPSQRNGGFGGQGKKWEDEVVPWLKTNGYPFADTITKSHLQAVGSMHAWPNFLAMLDWLVSVLKVHEQIFEASSLNVFHANSNPDITLPPREFANELEEREWMSVENWVGYLFQTYPEFLASDDFDVSAEKAILLEKYEAQYVYVKEENERDMEVVEKMERGNKDLERDDGSLKELREKEKLIERDLRKFETYKQQSMDFVKQWAEQAPKMFKQLEDAEKEIANKRAVHNDLARRVEAQNLSQLEVQSMTAEQSSLKSSLHATQIQTQEKCSLVGDLEVRLTRSTDAVRKLIDGYNKLVNKFHLNPPPEKWEKRGVSFLLEDLDATKRGYGVLELEETDLLRQRLELDSRFRELEKEVKEEGAKLEVLLETLDEKKKVYEQEHSSSQSKIDKIQRHVHELRTNNPQSRIFNLEQKIEEAKIRQNDVIQELGVIQRTSEAAFMRRIETIVFYYQSLESKISKMQRMVVEDMKA
ncbi:hypothetical protein BT69DRAFT_1332528 [Atractiella rhizophila]|nr:hypothetical protein BT69DRAFT_1332528 [Atractiella rhizophila]